MRNIPAVVIACFLLFGEGAGVLRAAQALRALFVGNSQTTVCDLPQMVKVLSESASPERPRIAIGRATKGGASLKKHWEAGDPAGTARALIRAEKWDYVVIQEIYRVDKGEFEEYATKFDDVIRNTGAQTILFATAHVTEFYRPGERYPDSFFPLNDMQIALAKERRTLVAAAGYSWIKYLGPNPSQEQLLDLYDEDKGHPGPKGTYIYACLLYAVMTKMSPEGLTNEFPGIRKKVIITKAEAANMQKAAWAQYQENRH